MIESPLRGLGLAAILVSTWLVSLLTLLHLEIEQIPWGLVIGAVLLRTFLQTGLFIVGHDAMHLSLVPGQRRLNHRFGAIALLLYGALPYRRCLRNHLWHHQAPGTRRDPDFHGPQRADPVAWYGRFMAGYLSWSQLLALVGAWLLSALVLSGNRPGGWTNVALFWALPLLLSSLQLFLFGTYLPHRGGTTTNMAWPRPLSLLACYHFGHHRQHHDHPEVPWFRLPERGYSGPAACVASGPASAQPDPAVIHAEISDETYPPHAWREA